MSFKRSVRDAILAALASSLTSMQEARAGLHRASELNDQTLNDPSEITQSSVELGMSGSLDASLERVHHAIAVLNDLDLAPMNTVQPGAIVTVGDESYFISVAADEVEVEGRTVEPLSPEAPFTRAMLGCAAGDTFTVRGRDYRIDSVS